MAKEDRTDTLNRSTDDKAAIAAFHQAIRTAQQNIARREADIKKIQARLNTTNWLEIFALGPSNLNNLEQIKAISDYTKLSSHDLNQKLAWHMAEIKELTDEVHANRMAIQQKENLAKSQFESAMQAKSKEMNLIYRTKFYENQRGFFAGLISNVTSDSADIKARLYASADQIIATCDLYDATIDSMNIWKSWDIVAKASAMDPTRAEYTDGSDKVFGILCNTLPVGMQGLKFLYNANNYTSLNFYLERIYRDRIDVEHAPDQYTQLVQKLSSEVEQINRTDARILLERSDKFRALSKGVKNDLIEQQSYINKVRFDIGYIDHKQKSELVDALLAITKSMENNIENFLVSKMKLKLNQTEFIDLKEAIQKRTAEYFGLDGVIKFGDGLGVGSNSAMSRATMLRPQL